MIDQTAQAMPEGEGEDEREVRSIEDYDEAELPSNAVPKDEDDGEEASVEEIEEKKAKRERTRLLNPSDFFIDENAANRLKYSAKCPPYGTTRREQQDDILKGAIIRTLGRGIDPNRLKEARHGHVRGSINDQDMCSAERTVYESVRNDAQLPSRRQEESRDYEKIEEYVDDARKHGCKSYKQIAKWLNDQGIKPGGDAQMWKADMIETRLHAAMGAPTQVGFHGQIDEMSGEETGGVDTLGDGFAGDLSAIGLSDKEIDAISRAEEETDPKIRLRILRSVAPSIKAKLDDHEIMSGNDLAKQVRQQRAASSRGVSESGRFKSSIAATDRAIDRNLAPYKAHMKDKERFKEEFLANCAKMVPDSFDRFMVPIEPQDPSVRRRYAELKKPLAYTPWNVDQLCADGRTAGEHWLAEHDVWKTACRPVEYRRPEGEEDYFDLSDVLYRQEINEGRGS